jgi:hypothetical protein
MVKLSDLRATDGKKLTRVIEETKQASKDVTALLKKANFVSGSEERSGPQAQSPQKVPSPPAISKLPEAAPALATPPAEVGAVINQIDEEQAAAEFRTPAQLENYSEEDVTKLKEAFDTLANFVNDKELVGQALYIILQLLHDRPHLVDILAPENGRDMVRALRVSYGTALKIKETKTTTRKKKAVEADELANELKALGGNFTV